MSSVAEMHAFVREAAGAATSSNWKERVRAAAHVLGLSFGRAKRHYYGEVARVDAEEMDNARAAIVAIRAAAKQRRELDHLAWLENEIARHRASGEELRGPHVDGLEHLLRLARSADSALAIPSEKPTD